MGVEWSQILECFAIHSDKARPYFRKYKKKKKHINFHSAGVGVNSYQT